MVNILVNKILGENEKSAFYFYLKEFFGQLNTCQVGGEITMN